MTTAKDQQSRAVITAWNAQADEHNQWETLGDDEKIEWAMKAARALPEGMKPATWAIYDAEGLYETRDTEEACKSFCDHYNARDEKLGGGLGPYTYKALYAAATRPPAAQEKK